MAKGAFWRLAAPPRGNMFLEVVPSFSSMVFRCGQGCVLEACSISSSSTTSSSSSRSSSSSSRPSSCNRFVLNRIQKDPEGTSSLGAACFWRSFRPSVAWCFGAARGTVWKPQRSTSAAAAAGPAAKLGLFLPESRRDVKPRDSMFLDVVPSFRAMVFCCFATAR